MKEFFKNQLETLYARTGFRQLENMMQSSTWEKDITDLISFMVEECVKPPFDKVQETAKMRVISKAVTEDPEFTGLNAKFVRRALNKWWQDNADRELEKINKAQSKPYEPLTPEQNEKVNVMLESYYRRLMTGGSMTNVRDIVKPEDAPKVGAEWKSGIERKAVSVGFKPPDAEAIMARELHMAYIRENYDARTGHKLQTWIPENEWLEQQKNRLKST